jgi:hypothetical protein
VQNRPNRAKYSTLTRSRFLRRPLAEGRGVPSITLPVHPRNKAVHRSTRVGPRGPRDCNQIRWPCTAGWQGLPILANRPPRIVQFGPLLGWTSVTCNSDSSPPRLATNRKTRLWTQAPRGVQRAAIPNGKNRLEVRIEPETSPRHKGRIGAVKSVFTFESLTEI